MGMLVEGAWTNDDGTTRLRDGSFDHQPTHFRNFISLDRSSGFSPEAGRYHLYAAKGCPWAHRTLIFRRLKKLESVITLTLIDGPRLQGYPAADGGPHQVPGTDCVVTHLHEIYTLAAPRYTGRASVPVLWDRRRCTIVSNESADIIRMFNSAFVDIAEPTLDYYPADLRARIDDINAMVYDPINNGVYKAGFSTSQAAYETAFDALFAALDRLDGLLATRRYLCGERITEADWRLFTTLFRFDSVYYCAFKCNKRRLVDYSNLWGYCRDLYQMPGIASVCFLDEIKKSYFGNPTINPTGTIPKGPALDFLAPHGRDRTAWAK